MDCNIQQYICCVAPPVDCWVSSHSLITVCTVYPPSIYQRTFRIDTLVAIVTVRTEIWISEHPPSSHLQSKLTINQWLLLVILRYLHASPYIIYRFPMATIVVVCLFSYVDCCIRNTPMVDCYIRCHNIFHIFQYTSVDCCVYIAKFLCCKCSFCKKTFVDWVSIDAPWLIVVFVCILHTLIVNRHHILYTMMPPLLCIINPNMLFIPSCTIMYS